MTTNGEQLHFTSDAEPGLRRRRSGTRVRYLDARGDPVRDPETLARIRALAIPPAWTDVWICTSPNGHLQATGRDARGRKQYRYHATWLEMRDRAKFDRLPEFGTALPLIRRAVERDLERRTLQRETVLGAVVRLLDTTLVRVGNEEYARANQSYGLTTLRNRHATLDPAGIRLVFRGKSGTRHVVRIDDRRVARIIRRCHELPGRLLFEYLDEEGECRPVRSQDVNDYLRQAAGIDLTAKDFRTWAGSCIAASHLAALPIPQSATEVRDGVASMLHVVSESLRNTPAVCRKSYVDPWVVEEFERGTLPRRWSSAGARSPRRLNASERRFLSLLLRRAAPARSAA
jgi:DNA topoisomerase-1